MTEDFASLLVLKIFAILSFPWDFVLKTFFRHWSFVIRHFYGTSLFRTAAVSDNRVKIDGANFD